jgi:hypothetical protein
MMMAKSSGAKLQREALAFSIKSSLALVVIAFVGLMLSFAGSPTTEIGNQLGASRPLMLAALVVGVVAVTLSLMRMRRLRGTTERTLN